MAKIYLEAGDAFVAASAGTIFGSTGTESVTVQAGVTGVDMDSAVEGATFAGNFADYTFAQNGIAMSVYNTDGALVTTFNSPDQTPIFADGEVDIVYSGGTMTIGGTTLVNGTGEETAKTDISVTSDTAGVAGVAENFTYAIDSSSNSVLSQLSSDVTLSGFTVGEDSLTFVDVANGTTTTASFVNDVVVSSSTISNLTNIIFDEDASGDSYQLVLTGIVDSDLSTVDMSVS